MPKRENLAAGSGSVDHGSRASAWAVLKEQRESRQLGRVTALENPEFHYASCRPRSTQNPHLSPSQEEV